jgi:hypothetical protein
MEMVHNKPLQPQQPLETFHGLNSQIELYPDHIRMMRTDTLTQVIPSLYNETKEINLNDIIGVYLHESRYVRTKWVTFAFQTTQHKYISMVFDRKDYAAADRFKNIIQKSLPQLAST